MTDTQARVYRAPVRYSISSTAPIRVAGSKDAPFRILNMETSGTVWLSENAGLRAGEGQPLHAGTSFLWLRPTELYAICDPGESCDIIITTEIDDWQPDPAAIAAAIVNSGIIIIDNPVTILQASINGPGQISTIDISRFQSLNISIALDVDNPVSPLDNRIQLVFTDGGTTSYIAQLVFSTEDQVWTAAVPCYGDGFALNIVTDSTFVAFVSGSHRPVQVIRQRIDEVDVNGTPVGAGTNVFFDTLAAGGIAVGDTQFVILPPWYGTILVDVRWVSPAVAAANFDLLIGSQIVPGAYNAYRQVNGVIVQGVAPAAHTYQCTTNIVATGDALVVTARNGYAAAGINFSARIVPLTGGLVS